MINLRLLKSALISLLVLAAVACSQKGPAPSDRQPDAAGAETAQAREIRQQRYAEGIAAMASRDFDRAQQIFSEFIRDYPQMAGAYLNLAIIHFENSEYDRATQSVELAISLNSALAQAYNLRAQLKIIDRQILQARDDYQKAVGLNPDYANAQFNLALLYDIYLQDVRLALRHYEIYLALIEEPDETTQNWVEHLKRTLKNG